ncbi:VOC family protein [Siminovitchia sp. FSL H7-0308]|uniref:Catechol 2,3-dioxygenase n=1 Tax=Siminovitchia thermophila TaxID=1245522 RepID=A0ABS2R4Q1_9BACI|nr:VOC family protein [Siminovitchia thermophila]MBM7714380.1 catechol 2,3-dioxygenase [Siminovitchia thermophila]ONK25066.1 glyoxalase [Bacillus sp. VT-16-64]
MVHPIVGTIQLTVRDLERAADFYQNILGLRLLKRTGSAAVFTADGKRALLALEENKHAKPRKGRTTGLYHMAFLLPDRSSLADVLQHFIDIRLPLQGASDHHVSEAIYLADPEGNGIEIYADRSPDTWRKGDQIFMTTAALNVENLMEDASESGWKGMPSATVMGHIHLQVADLVSSEHFYCDGLGFDKILHYGSQALFISKHRYHHHIGLNTWNSAGAPPPEENSTGLKRYSLLFSSEEEREKAVRRLDKINVSIFREKGIIIVKDPSDIQIKLEVDHKGEHE